MMEENPDGENPLSQVGTENPHSSSGLRLNRGPQVEGRDKKLPSQLLIPTFHKV